MMDFFLLFLLLDRRYLCDFRPALKNFSFLFLLPIAFYLLIICFNLYCLFPFTKLMKTSYLIVGFETIIKMISIVSLILMITNLYNLTKKQPKKQKNIFVLIFEKIKNDKEENFVYYEDYWLGRTILFSINGIIALLTSITNLTWSIFYVLHRNMFLEIYDWIEQFIIFCAYLNILCCLPVLFALASAMIIKVSFVLSAMICPSCVLSLSETCCKRNKGLERTIDFSDLPILEPEYV